METSALGFLGVMTGRHSGSPPIAEPAFCSQLCQAAPLFNLGVLVFQPEGVAADGSSITGYVWQDGSWRNVTAAPPDVVYNRCFYSSREERQEASAALAALPRSLPWSRGLPDKWSVYKILKSIRSTAPLLPETRIYTGRDRLGTMLAEREYGVFLKPRAGSHGKRTLHARLIHGGTGGLRVSGRDGANTPFHLVFASGQKGIDWIHDFIDSRRYIIQPYLHLTGSTGQPFDVRVLMQKDGSGVWGLTGMAVRLGSKGTLTSNLHGGGTAVSPLPFLTAEYGSAGKEIVEELASYAAFLPPVLENACGRLGELGLDFGIDEGGRIWLLEANSKPGRSVFRLTGDRRAVRLSAENPLRYARHLLLSRRGQPTWPPLRLHSHGNKSMIPKEDS
ncbi:YheC/YheD family endospore coat-associated protein [Paenibacillus agri]|uniref:YheC/YheD family protein n=1 Tax=Paenibacillus agri TaxID=2744309 RepID=A0A850ERP5_9BACL|nr:YheC/YheD family protein [Paenibacillus agri]NUU63878.1 YheC/YheD family protein [Paenibacillus agri]